MVVGLICEQPTTACRPSLCRWSGRACTNVTFLAATPSRPKAVRRSLPHDTSCRRNISARPRRAKECCNERGDTTVCEELRKQQQQRIYTDGEAAEGGRYVPTIGRVCVGCVCVDGRLLFYTTVLATATARGVQLVAEKSYQRRRSHRDSWPLSESALILHHIRSMESVAAWSGTTDLPRKRKAVLAPL